MKLCSSAEDKKVCFAIFTDLHVSGRSPSGERRGDLSLGKLKQCGHNLPPDLDFIICLGDLVDTPGDPVREISDLGLLREQLGRFPVPVHFVMGNHDLETMDRQTFKTTIGDPRTPFYAFLIQFARFIVLDANYCIDETPYARGNFNWKESLLPVEQLQFLKNELAQSKKQPTIVFIHQNLDERKEPERQTHVVKNAAAVRRILEQSNGPVTVFQGHDHAGLDQQIDGVRYVTLPALCTGETIPPGAFRVVSVGMDGHLEMEQIQ